MKTGHVHSSALRCLAAALALLPTLPAQAAPSVGTITVSNLLTNDGFGAGGADYGGTWGDTGGYSKNYHTQSGSWKAYDGTLDDPDCSAMGQYSPIQGGNCPGISFKDDSTCCDVTWSPPNGKSEWNSSITNTTTVVSPYITTFKARHASEMRTQAQLAIATAMYYMPKFSVTVPISGTGPWKLDLAMKRLGIIVNNSANFITVQPLTTTVSGGSLISGSLNLPATSAAGTVNQTSTAVMTGNGAATLVFTSDYEVDSLVTNLSSHSACWRAGQGNNGASIGCNPAVNATDGVFLEGTFTYVDHLRYEFDPTVAATCAPLPVTVKACADNASACTTLYTGSPSITPTATAASGTWTWSSNPYTIPATGTGSLTLSSTAGGIPVTLGATGISVECFNTAGTSISCTLPSFATCDFAILDGYNKPWTTAKPTNIYTKLAGVAFPNGGVQVAVINTTAAPNIKVTAYTGAPTIQLVDANTGTNCASRTALSLLSNSAYAVADAGEKTIAATYADAGRNLQIRATDTANNLAAKCSDSFTVRPASLVLTSDVQTSLGVKRKAGWDTFTLTATAKSGAGSPITTTGYTGVGVNPALDVSKLAGVRADLSTGTTATGSLSGTTFNTANSGVATIPNVTYSEVGFFNLQDGAIYDNSFASGSGDIAASDCTADYSNSVVNGKYGCSFKESSLTSHGRFYPHHFDLMVTPACNTAGAPNDFTYSKQPFSLSATAKNGLSSPTTTQNYSIADGFSKKTEVTVTSPVTPVGTLTGSTVANTSNGTSFAQDTSALPSVVKGYFAPEAFGCSSCTSTVPGPGAAADGAAKFTFSTSPSVPATLTLHAVEATGGDGVASGTDPTLLIRSGQVSVISVSGSSRFDLPVDMRMEYYNSSAAWVKYDATTFDKCTSVSLAALTSPSPALLSATCVLDTGNPGASGRGCSTAAVAAKQFQSTPGALSPASGSANLWLKAPGAGNVGTVTLTPTATGIPSWLDVVPGNATFTDKSGPIIYRRERY